MEFVGVSLKAKKLIFVALAVLDAKRSKSLANTTWVRGKEKT